MTTVLISSYSRIDNSFRLIINSENLNSLILLFFEPQFHDEAHILRKPLSDNLILILYYNKFQREGISRIQTKR